jgi:hypothetical protein
LAAVVITDFVGGDYAVQSLSRKHLTRSSIASPAATEDEAKSEFTGYQAPRDGE